MNEGDCEGCGAIARVSNAVRAAGRFLKAKPGEHFVDHDTRVSRMDACNKCEKYADGVCLDCGCFVRLKSRLQTEDCPLGKW